MKNLRVNEIDSVIINLIEKSIEVMEKAYAPYSNFKVGAALIDSSGAIHTGCNIESCDYTLTSHAEMVAVDSMVKSGERKINIIAISMISDNVSIPCGLCRQKLAEFASDDLLIYGVALNENREIEKISQFSLGELLPNAFRNNYL